MQRLLKKVKFLMSDRYKQYKFLKAQWHQRDVLIGLFCYYGSKPVSARPYYRLTVNMFLAGERSRKPIPSKATFYEQWERRKRQLLGR